MNGCEAYRVDPVWGPYGFVPERCKATRGLRYYFDTHGQMHAFCPALGHLASVLRLHAPMDEWTERKAAMDEQQAADDAEHERHDQTGGDPLNCYICQRIGEQQTQDWYAL